MTRPVFAPGSDDITLTSPQVGYTPANGAGGQFARFIKGSTPKYATNSGLREEMYRNSMARMFVRVDQGEWSLFRNSIGDPQTQTLVDRLAGDPSRPSNTGQGYNDTGYMDFLLRQVQHSFREKVQSMETLSDNYVVYYFGQSAPVWTYTGAFINTVQDDQASNFVRLYLNVLRGTQLARRQKVITLRYDSFAVAGTIENIDWSIQAENELLCPFSFTFRVKRLYIVNYTAGWVPTRPNGPIADINAVAYDGGRPRNQGSVVSMFGSVPPDTVPGPTPTSQDQPTANVLPQDNANPAVNFSTNPNPDVRPGRPEPAPTPGTTSSQMREQILLQFSSLQGQ